MATTVMSTTTVATQIISSTVAAIPHLTQSTNASSTPTVSCNDSPNYFVITRDLTDSVGSDILVKYKTSSTQTFACVYNVGIGDYELKHLDAGYFLGLVSHFIILDFGTGPPPRSLEIDDLNSRREVFTDGYSIPISINDNSLTYWSPTSTIPTIANCPDLNTYNEEGLGAEIETQVTVNLTDLTRKELGNYRCAVTQ